MFSPNVSVCLPRESVAIDSTISVKYNHKSNKKDYFVQMCFTVYHQYFCSKKCEHVCHCGTYVQSLILSTDSPKKCGSNPSILNVFGPGKIISLTIIQISPSDTNNNEKYNLLVFYTEGDEMNLYMSMYRISYDRSSILQPSSYHNGHYRGLRLILTIPIIFKPYNYLAEQFTFDSFSRMFQLHLLKNTTFMACDIRVLLRLKTYNKIMSLLIRRLIPTYKIFRHYQKVYNKIEISIMSRVFTTYFKTHCVLHTDSEDGLISSLHLIWDKTQNNLIGIRKIDSF
jgi:hypothetical protein